MCLFIIKSYIILQLQRCSVPQPISCNPVYYCNGCLGTCTSYQNLSLSLHQILILICLCDIRSLYETIDCFTYSDKDYSINSIGSGNSLVM